eukprot:TRINITY_DN232_c0_g4_i2.p1 TRINITY_DN232_c0_g4~~TRINITY_DN232_c0_g4_i2.p1  ORF type:complete len:737 (+),score=181.83 TRINITY_DN232_c0_g4_i2:78-2288(+)
MLGALLLPPLVTAAVPNCSVKLTKHIKGTCNSRTVGCSMGPLSPHSMHVQEGCCGYFTCDGFENVKCCAATHTEYRFCTCGPVPNATTARDFYVAAGAKGGDGSKDKPFGSVQDCVNVASYTNGVSTCNVGEGLYRENVVMAPSGCNIVGAGAGKTILTGAEEVTWKFEQHKDQIYKVTIPEGAIRDSGVQQVFFDGDYIPEARWPNAQLADMLDRNKLASADDNSSRATGVLSSSDIPAINWTGGRATMLIGSRVFSWVKPILNCDADKHSVVVRNDFNSLDTSVDLPGTLFWLSGVMGALDSPGEWYYDSADNTLYVWAPDGHDPTGHISVKTRSFCLDASVGATKMKNISHMTFHGCTVTAMVDNSQFTDLELLYPTYNPWTAWRDIPSGPMPDGTIIVGDGNVLERLILRYSNNWGLYIVGSRNVLRDVFIESTCWLGTLDMPPITIGFSKHNPGGGPSAETESDYVQRYFIPQGDGNVIERATVRFFGNSGIVTSQMSNEIRLTHVSEGGLLGGDDACIHAANPQTPCDSWANCSKHWHHNWVHNCREKCVRCDDRSRNCSIHHNVVFNCGKPLGNGGPAGILLKGEHNAVYQCTIFNTTGQGGLVPRCVHENVDFQMWNNVIDRLHSNCYITNTTFPYMAGNYYGGNWTSLKLDDPSGYRFKPLEGSPLLGIGVDHQPPFAADASGVDVGAYQSKAPASAVAGDPYNVTDWRPGCSFHPLCFDMLPTWHY